MNDFLIHSCIKFQAQNRPEAIAFRCMQKEVTYSQLHDITQKIAAKLVDAAKVNKGDRIGILMPRCIENSYAIYSILSAGGVYVPLDPSAPIDRIGYIIDDCQIDTILTVPNQSVLIAQLQERRELNLVIGVESTASNCISWDEVTSGSPFDQELDISVDDLAYILYTSGSTGNPKGIMHTHFSGASFANLCVDTFSLTSFDVIANHAPIFFDISTLAYFAGPRCGATTVILTDMELMFPASVAAFVKSNKVTVWYSVPLALVRMMDANVVSQNDFNTLRIVLYAGEAFAPHMLKKWMDLVPHAQVVNLFGPTETNVCTVYAIPNNPDGINALPIGRPWADTYYKMIYHEQSNEEHVGELYIASPTLMHGYWNQEDRTKAAFVYLNSQDGVNRKYYKTGDLIRQDDDGILHFMGRIDHQVKINGYRVELSEVESVIESIKEVKEVACLVQVIENEQILVAYVVIISDIDVTSIVSHLKTRLPRYAIPREIVLMDKLPRTVRGKINRLELADKK